MVSSLLCRSRCSYGGCGCGGFQFHALLPELIKFLLLVTEKLHQISLHPLEFSIFSLSGCFHAQHIRFEATENGPLLLDIGQYVLEFGLQIALSLLPFQRFSFVDRTCRLASATCIASRPVLSLINATSTCSIINIIQAAQLLLKMSNLFL